MASLVQYKTLAVFGLLFGSIVLGLIALLLSLRVDTIINVDLYKSNLQFSYIWANKYGASMRLLQDSIFASLVLFVVSALSFFGYVRFGKSFLKSLCFPLLTTTMALNLVAAYSFHSMDQIINVDLYSFGLQFRSSWVLPYVTYSMSVLALIGGSIVLGIVSIVLLFYAPRPAFGAASMKLNFSFLALFGFIILGLSILYTSSILAFVGLGFVFWGFIFTFIRSEQYSKRVLLEASSSNQMSFLNQVAGQLKCEGDAVYLPANFFGESETPRVFIPKNNNVELPTPEQTKVATGPFLQKPFGLLIDAPGANLIALFEERLKKNFTKIKLIDFQSAMLKLVDELEVAKKIYVLIEGDKVRVELRNSAFAFSKGRVAEGFGLNPSVGSVIASALACALCRSSGKIVVIEKEQRSKNGQSQLIDFRLL